MESPRLPPINSPKNAPTSILKKQPSRFGSDSGQVSTTRVSEAEGVRDSMAEKILSKKFSNTDLGMASGNSRITRQPSKLDQLMKEDDAKLKKQPSRAGSQGQRQLLAHLTDAGPSPTSFVPDMTIEEEGEPQAFTELDRQQRQQLIEAFERTGSMQRQPSLARGDSIARRATAGVEIASPSGLQRTNTLNRVPSMRASAGALSLSPSRRSIGAGVGMSLGERLSTASNPTNTDDWKQWQRITTISGSLEVMHLPLGGPAKREDVEVMNRVYAEVKAMNTGPVTVASLKKYASVVSMDGSAGRELNFVITGLVQSLERTKKEIFSFKDFLRNQYPMASDEELQVLINSVTKVERPTQRVRKEGTVPTAAQARAEIDPSNMRVLREIFSNIDRERRGEIKFEFIADIISPIAKDLTPNMVVSQLRRATGNRKMTCSFDDFMVWHAMNQKSPSPISLDKIQTSLLGPSFVLSTYIHEESSAEKAKEVQSARPEGSGVGAVMRGTLPVVPGAAGSPRPSAGGAMNTPTGGSGVPGLSRAASRRF